MLAKLPHSSIVRPCSVAKPGLKQLGLSVSTVPSAVVLNFVAVDDFGVRHIASAKLGSVNFELVEIDEQTLTWYEATGTRLS